MIDVKEDTMSCDTVKDKESLLSSQTSNSVMETVSTTAGSVEPVSGKRKPGRPKKSEIDAKLKPGKRGRPKGDFTKARELCARMLVSEGDRMLQTLIKMALTDGHPNQIAALKMCLDRSLPISYFENKDTTGPAGSGIVINITGLPTQVQSTSDIDDSVIDVEVNSNV